MVERFILTELSDELILNKAKKIAAKGWIQQTENYCYLKVDDDFIHTIYPLLMTYGNLAKPDYFNPANQIGAHISVIYPEEETKPHPENVGQIHSFNVNKLIKAQYGAVDYWALSVLSPSLTNLRHRHQLGSNPTFKGQNIGFHITVAVKVYKK